MTDEHPKKPEQVREELMDLLRKSMVLLSDLSDVEKDLNAAEQRLVKLKGDAGQIRTELHKLYLELEERSNDGKRGKAQEERH